MQTAANESSSMLSTKKGVNDIRITYRIKITNQSFKKTNSILYYQSETLDFVFWNRQLIGLAIGLTAGILQLEGMFVIIGFFVTMFLVSNMYAYKMLSVSDDDFPNNELMMEGVGNSAGIFFVS